MRYLFILSGIVCLSFMLLPACAPEPVQEAEPVTEEAPSTEADVAAIEAIFKQYDDTITAGDLEGYMTLFVENYVVMPPGSATLVGKDAYRSYAQPFFDQFDMEETINVQETEIAGDWAFMRSTFTWLLTPKAGGEPIEEVGTFVTILKRQSDGSWKISHGIWNSDNPPPEEPAS